MSNNIIKDYVEKTEILQKEFDAIRKEYENFTEGDFPEEDFPELVALTVENTKLNHRIAVLKTAISDIRKKMPAGKIINILEHLNTVFSEAICRTFPDLPEAPTVIALAGNNPKFGDYQCNSAMPIAQLLKAQGIKTNPRDIATKIITNVLSSEIIDKLEVANAGFVNIFLSKSYGESALLGVLKNGVSPPHVDKKLRVVVDFSSPNIAKQMHVGHLRSTIIGESTCRLLEFFGHDVLRINHVGDWGTQFGMLLAHLEDRFPNYLTESPPISDLQAFYKESKARFDDDPEFKKRAYACVVKLQAFDENYYKGWQLICDVSRKEFQQIYDKLDITLIERGESFYQSRMEKVVKDLQEKDLLEEDEGRQIMWGTDSKDGIPFTIIKSDGGFTYDTSDMATIKQRLHEEKADWLIYITDAGQATHFKSLVNCATRAGILDLSRVRYDHVTFGVVLGEDGKKFKTRSGETVKLNDLLEEGLKRARDKLAEKKPVENQGKVLTSDELDAAQKSVAYGCIKYADLSHNRTHEYVFSFDKMLDDKGNTAAYLLYAFARIRSIARNANLTSEDILKAADTVGLELHHEKEWKLGKVLLRFPDVLLKVSQDLYLHHLCEFTYDVCTTFTEFYDACYCIERNELREIVKVNMSRIILCEITAKVLAKCFDILGINPVSKM